MVVISEERRNKKNHLERVGEKNEPGQCPCIAEQLRAPLEFNNHDSKETPCSEVV